MTCPSEQLDVPEQAFQNEPEQNCSEIDLKDAVILYVGGESLNLTNLLMTHSSCQVRCAVLPTSFDGSNGPDCVGILI